MKKTVHEITALNFEGNYLTIQVDGKFYKTDIHRYSQKLLRSDSTVRQHYEISPSGYGIHWPEIDEDLSVDALIRMGRH